MMSQNTFSTDFSEVWEDKVDYPYPRVYIIFCIEILWQLNRLIRVEVVLIPENKFGITSCK